MLFIFVAGFAVGAIVTWVTGIVVSRMFPELENDQKEGGQTP